MKSPSGGGWFLLGGLMFDCVRKADFCSSCCQVSGGVIYDNASMCNQFLENPLCSVDICVTPLLFGVPTDITTV